MQVKRQPALTKRKLARYGEIYLGMISLNIKTIRTPLFHQSIQYVGRTNLGVTDFYKRGNPIFRRELDSASRFPNLHWIWEQNIPILKGLYLFHTIYKDREFKETFNLIFTFPQQYPELPPQVYETEGKIPHSFHHYTNGGLCLATRIEYKTLFLKEPTLEGFINNLVNPYLLSWLWLEKFGKMPWGERRHGWIGICESYQELLKINNQENVIPFLKRLALNNINQREICPCGSGIPYRNCHKKIVNRAFLHYNRNDFISDYHDIISGIRVS